MIGMAGSGKTTLVQRIHTELRMRAMGTSPSFPTSENSTTSSSSSITTKPEETSSTSSSSSSPSVPSSVTSSTIPTNNLHNVVPIPIKQDKLSSFIVNLDPAVLHLPYGPNIDIRDTVNYKEVMKQYTLGPNGAIITSLNLFATRFDQVTNLLKGKIGICE